MKDAVGGIWPPKRSPSHPHTALISGIQTTPTDVLEVMTMFKKIRSLTMPYETQGLIYFTCRNFKSLHRDVQKNIADLCTDIGGPHSRALFEFLTTQNHPITICQKNHIANETTLYRLRKRFYERFTPFL